MKGLITSIAAALTLLFSGPAKADNLDYGPSYVHNTDNIIEEHAAVLGANVALGGLVGCIGAEVSGDGCLEGLLRGSLGGFITYAGLEIGSYNAKVPFAGLTGRGIVDLGSSIVSNAAYSRGFLERFETSLGPVLLSIDAKLGTHAYILPISAFTVGLYAIAGHDLNLLDSIEDGTLVFQFDGPNNLPNGDRVTLGNTISNIPIHTASEPWTRSHENMHTYQGSRFMWADELMPNLSIFRYGSELLNGALLLSESINDDFYEYNPLENEAYILGDINEAR